jgi:hypothetical protein
VTLPGFYVRFYRLTKEFLYTFRANRFLEKPLVILGAISGVVDFIVPLPANFSALCDVVDIVGVRIVVGVHLPSLLLQASI